MSDAAAATAAAPTLPPPTRRVLLSLGFGFGDDFLAAWQAWREDPTRLDAGRPERLVCVAIEPDPPSAGALAQALRTHLAPRLAAALLQSWPPLTPNLHRLVFDDGSVELWLGLGTVEAWLPELVVEVDAIHVQRADAIAGLSPSRLGKALARLAAPGATFEAPGADPALQAGLVAAGFALVGMPATPGAAPQTQARTLARFAPAFATRRAPSHRRSSGATEAHALIIGAGLAGCSAAAALATQGWRSTVLDRQAQPAAEASGNPAGLFHGIVNAHDGVHARFNRAAALAARDAVHDALVAGVPGGANGLLRLETRLDAAQMRTMLARLRLPPGYVQVLAADEATALAGLPLRWPCWLYPGGGWVQPGGLARAFLARAGARADLRLGAAVDALRRTASGWRAVDAQGRTLAEAPTVVLANAADTLRLLRNAGAAEGAPGANGNADVDVDVDVDVDADVDADTDWPLERVRGQVSLAPASRIALPRLPIAGSGYLLPAIGGQALFGATAQRGDPDPSVRAEDHRRNLTQLEHLTGRASGLAVADLDGRTAWRSSAADRLPVVGAVPARAGPGTRLDQPRLVPRVPGLFVFGALGSRGITWSALGAQVLAAGVTGAPAPLEASLLDAIDPARFVSRRARRASRG